MWLCMSWTSWMCVLWAHVFVCVEKSCINILEIGWPSLELSEKNRFIWCQGDASAVLQVVTWQWGLVGCFHAVGEAGFTGVCGAKTLFKPKRTSDHWEFFCMNAAQPMDPLFPPAALFYSSNLLLLPSALLNSVRTRWFDSELIEDRHVQLKSTCKLIVTTRDPQKAKPTQKKS